MAWSPQARRAALIARRRKARMTPKNRKAYRGAKRQLKGQINVAYMKNPTRANRKKQIQRYDRGIADLKTKHLGKKKRSDRYVRNTRRAKTVAAHTAGVAIAAAPHVANYYANKPRKSEYEKVAKKTAKANKKNAASRYKQDRKMSTQARKRNLAAHGMNYHGQTKRSRKPVKVTSHRLPGQAMIGSR